MTEWVIVSGSGGVGKTLISSCLASLAGSAVLVDGDLTEGGLSRRLDALQSSARPLRQHTRAEAPLRFLESAAKPDHGRLNAIGSAVDLSGAPSESLSGVVSSRRTTHGLLYSARMDRGAGNYGSLVSLMRKQARQTAAELGRKFVITDGPGGNGSPVVASIQGAEQLLVLAEPTLASRAAMVRTVALAQYLEVPVSICINKCSNDGDVCRDLVQWCTREQCPVLGCIPHDPAQTRYGQCTPLLRRHVVALWWRMTACIPAEAALESRSASVLP